MTSPKTVKNRDRGSGGGESGRGTKYKLISIRKKSQVIGTFLPLNFWVIWAYDYPLSSAERSCTPNFEYTQPLDFKKVLFLPLNSRWYLSPLSLFLWEVYYAAIPLSFLYLLYDQAKGQWTGLDKYAFGGTTFNYAIFVPEPIQSLLLWPPGHYK